MGFCVAMSVGAVATPLLPDMNLRLDTDFVPVIKVSVCTKFSS
jgi:hypothetical protein